MRVDEWGIVRRRMHSVRLGAEPLTAPEDVVGWFGAVQSQDYGPAKWSLGQRCAGVTDPAVDRAFADGTILRTHVLRPTWHFVLPADIRWMLELTAPRVHQLNAHYYRQLGLDAALLERSTRVLVDALSGSQQRTRKELRAILAEAGITTDGPQLGYILMNAELNGVVCSGALRGRQHTYALLDERAPHARGLPREEALAEVAVRFFTSHGPATAKDLRWWASLTLAEIREGLELAGSRLERELVDGVEYWSAPLEPGPAAPSQVRHTPTVHLLQGYDEYVVAFSESRHLINLAGAARTLAPDTLLTNGVLLLDGQLAGHWKRTPSRGAVLIEASLYAPLDDAQSRALGAEADRHGAFLDATASVVTTLL